MDNRHLAGHVRRLAREARRVASDHDPIRAIRGLKEEAGADIVQYGLGPLSRALLAEGLLDELRLWVHPFLLGTGTPDDLLHRPGSSGSFMLTDSTALPNGIVILTLAAKSEQDAQ